MIDQGTLLDSVEYNIEMTGVEMVQAVGELKEATRWVSVLVIFPCMFLSVPRLFRCLRFSRYRVSQRLGKRRDVGRAMWLVRAPRCLHSLVVIVGDAACVVSASGDERLEHTAADRRSFPANARS